MPTINSDPNVDQEHPPIHPEQSVEEKLDVIITYLHRIDKRDRIRMWSGTLHSLLTLVPLILTLVSLWYFYAHSQDMIRSFAGAMSGGMLGNGASNSSQPAFMEMFNQYIQQYKQ